jgi:hypothetical protein
MPTLGEDVHTYDEVRVKGQSTPLSLEVPGSWVVVITEGKGGE